MTDEIIPTELTADKARDRLDYDPETGVFRWRWCAGMSDQWNGLAGKVAGSDKDDGYRVIRIDGILHRAHRLAWLVAYGAWPADQIDHINGNRADNRIANLRGVTNAENMRNTAMYSNNTSGITGVTWAMREAKWSAQIRANGRKTHLGYFDIFEEAVAARKAAEVRYGFHANHGRVARQAKSG